MDTADNLAKFKFWKDMIDLNFEDVTEAIEKILNKWDMLEGHNQEKAVNELIKLKSEITSDIEIFKRNTP